MTCASESNVDAPAEELRCQQLCQSLMCPARLLCKDSKNAHIPVRAAFNQGEELTSVELTHFGSGADCGSEREWRVGENCGETDHGAGAHCEARNDLAVGLDCEHGLATLQQIETLRLVPFAAEHAIRTKIEWPGKMLKVAHEVIYCAGHQKVSGIRRMRVFSCWDREVHGERPFTCRSWHRVVGAVVLWVTRQCAFVAFPQRSEPIA